MLFVKMLERAVLDLEGSPEEVKSAIIWFKDDKDYGMPEYISIKDCVEGIKLTESQMRFMDTAIAAAIERRNAV